MHNDFDSRHKVPMSLLFQYHEIFIFIGDSVAILCRGKEARRLTSAIILNIVQIRNLIVQWFS